MQISVSISTIAIEIYPITSRNHQFLLFICSVGYYFGQTGEFGNYSNLFNIHELISSFQSAFSAYWYNFFLISQGIDQGIWCKKTRINVRKNQVTLKIRYNYEEKKNDILEMARMCFPQCI